MCFSNYSQFGIYYGKEAVMTPNPEISLRSYIMSVWEVVCTWLGPSLSSIAFLTDLISTAS